MVQMLIVKEEDKGRNSENTVSKTSTAIPGYFDGKVGKVVGIRFN
jgi:hypothetical protein